MKRRNEKQRPQLLIKENQLLLNKTTGNLSRVRKIDEATALKIRAEYQAGKRGNDRAKKYGISAVQFNKIGRKAAWSQS